MLKFISNFIDIKNTNIKIIIYAHLSILLLMLNFNHIQYPTYLMFQQIITSFFQHLLHLQSPTRLCEHLPKL